MAKKSNKTSYVLDLISRGAASPDAETTAAPPPSWMHIPEDVIANPPAPPAEFIAQPVTAARAPTAAGSSMAAGTARAGKAIGPDKHSEESLSGLLKMSLENALRESDPTYVPEDGGAREITDSCNQSALAYEPEEEIDYSQMTTFEEGDDTMEKEMITGLGNSFKAENLDSVSSDYESAKSALRNSSSSDHIVDESYDTADEYMLVNVSEEVVRNKAPELMKEIGICMCPKCVNDVVALALNNLPPKYVVTKKGMLYAKINACLPQYQTDLITKITAACNTVKANSRHTNEDYQKHLQGL